METGQRISGQKINIDPLSSRYLSIQVSLNGFSFCVLDREANSVVDFKKVRFEKKRSPDKLLKAVRDYLEVEFKHDTSFHSVRLVHDNELQVIVPNALFDEDCLADYLKFNGRILQTDFISYDPVETIDSKNVYIPYVNINNFFYELIGSFEYKHLSTVLLDSILSMEKNATDKKVYVHIGMNSYEIIVINQANLLFYNSFEYETKEDFIYYLLFSLEQLQMNPENTELIMIGIRDEKDPLFEIAYTYIRNVEVYNLAKLGFTMDTAAELTGSFSLIQVF